MGLDNRDYYRPSGFGGFTFFPPVLKKLIIINVVVFFISIILQMIKVTPYATAYLYMQKYFALLPFDSGFLPWQLITYQFMHDVNSIGHILFNMFILWMFGMELENMWGSRKFLLFYLIGGIGAGILQLLSMPLAPTIGASGAVYAVMVAFAMMFPDRYIFLWFLIPVKAKYLIGFFVILEFLSVGEMSFVAHTAHIGGAITGLILILLDKKYHFNVNPLFEFFSRTNVSGKKDKTDFNFRRPMGDRFKKGNDIREAEFYEINNKDENEISQEEIDRILDKISQSGYQNLTDPEKRILFEASKKN